MIRVKTDISNWVWAAASVVMVALLLDPLSTTWELTADLGHSWAAPLLMAYLWWERWSERPPLIATGPVNLGWDRWVWGVAVLIALSLPGRLLLTVFPVWPVAVALHVALVVGVTLFVVGRHFGRAGVRWVGGPLLILPGVLPWPGMVDRAFIQPLREGIATIVTEFSNLAGHPAIASGTTIKLANGWVGIDEACGGIRSLQAGVTAALFFGEWLRLSFGRRVALVAVAIGAALAGNLGRVGFLSWCATGPEGRLDQWHDLAGWVALGFSLAMTGWIGTRWGRRADCALGEISPPRPSPAFLPPVPRPAGWAVALLIGLIAVDGATRLWYTTGDPEIAEDTPLWTLRLPTNQPSYRVIPLPDGSRELLKPDAFHSATWTGVDGMVRMVNYVEWHEGQVARSSPFLHNPTRCLPTSGSELIATLDVVEVPWAHGTIPFQTYEFRQFNESLIVAFTVWDPRAAGPFLSSGPRGSWLNWMRIQWSAVASANIHQPAQMLSFAIQGKENHDRIVSELSRLIGSTTQFGPQKVASDD